MGKKLRVSSGGPWEDVLGYCRAIRTGNRIVVAGTTATRGTEIVGIGSVYEQTVYILKIIRKAIEKLGGQLSDVIVTRIYITDMDAWEEVARVHSACFDAHRPVTTIVEVKSLIDPRLLVEIEVEASLD